MGERTKYYGSVYKTATELYRIREVYVKYIVFIFAHSYNDHTIFYVWFLDSWGKTN